MLFTKPLYDKIFFSLADSQEYTIQSLHKHVSQHEKISLPNFYRIIDQLLDNQILTKEHGKIKLHTAWILSLLELTNKVQNTYMQTNNIKISLKDGDQKTFSASSLVDLDNIWADLLSTMALESPADSNLYMYNAHLYHILGIPETETTNLKNMKQQLKNVYLLVWNDGIMDTHAATILRMYDIQVVCDATTKFMQEWYFLNIIGDYILETVFPPVITQYFRVLFDTVKDMKDFNPEAFQNIFKMKVECKITIRKSQKDARNFSQEIQKYFS